MSRGKSMALHMLARIGRINYYLYLWNEGAFWKGCFPLKRSPSNVISEEMTLHDYWKNVAEQAQWPFGHLPSSWVMLSLILNSKHILTHGESLFILKLPVQSGAWCSLFSAWQMEHHDVHYLDNVVYPHGTRLESEWKHCVWSPDQFVFCLM